MFAELAKLLTRPRTWVTIAVLALLPVIVAVFLKATGVAPQPGHGPPLLAEVLGNGTLFPVAALGLVLPLFLPAAVAIIGGDAIAGEAASGTLRYLLIRPVSRARLLVSKMVMIAVFVILAVGIIAAVGFVVGGSLFGVHGVPSVSGGPPLPVPDVTNRILISILFAMVSMLGVGAAALFASVMTDSPIAAALTAVGVLLSSEILDLIDAAASIRPYLLTHYWLAFVDLFRSPILWHNVVRGFLVQGAYIAVFLSAAWAKFSTKDITS